MASPKTQKASRSTTRVRQRDQSVAIEDTGLYDAMLLEEAIALEELFDSEDDSDFIESGSDDAASDVLSLQASTSESEENDSDTDTDPWPQGRDESFTLDEHDGSRQRRHPQSSRPQRNLRRPHRASRTHARPGRAAAAAADPTTGRRRTQRRRRENTDVTSASGVGGPPGRRSANRREGVVWVQQRNGRWQRGRRQTATEAAAAEPLLVDVDVNDNVDHQHDAAVAAVRAEADATAELLKRMREDIVDLRSPTNGPTPTQTRRRRSRRAPSPQRSAAASAEEDAATPRPSLWSRLRARLPGASAAESDSSHSPEPQRRSRRSHSRVPDQEHIGRSAAASPQPRQLRRLRPATASPPRVLHESESEVDVRPDCGAHEERSRRSRVSRRGRQPLSTRRSKRLCVRPAAAAAAML